MKALLVLVVLALAAAGAYFFYFGDHPIAFMQGLEPAKKDAAVAKKDFKDLNALLQGDMDHIPRDLRDARQMPTHAYDVKSRVAPYLSLHEEYQTVTQGCDAIIAADQDFNERQAKCGLDKPSAGATFQEKVRAKLATLENRPL